MKNSYANLGLILLVLVVAGLWRCSSSSTPFAFDTLTTVLNDAAPDAEGSILDTDGDGLGDAIDWDGDGNPDIEFDPGTVGDLPDGSSSSSSSSSSSGGVDTTDPIRTDNGNCVVIGDEPIISINHDGTIDTGDLGSHSSIIVRVASNGTNVVVDMAGASNLQRVIIHMSGNSNTVHVRNADMAHGFCNQGSGNSNSFVLESSNQANIVDLMSGTGGSNNLDSLFTPDLGLIYNLSGNDHCIAYTAATDLLDSSSNDNGHTIYTDAPNDGVCYL